MSDHGRFDPRFDPAFQPGYEGPVAVPTRSSAPARVGSPPHVLPAVPDAPAPAPASPASLPSSADSEPTEEPLPRRANPFLIALGAVAVLLLGGGLYLVSSLREQFAGDPASSDFDYVTQQVLMYAAPLLLVLGLATGIGVLFLLASRWDRR
jgi:hypothetical protein